MLWDAAELTQQQSWDWDAYYAQTGVGTQGAYVGKPMPMFPVANVDHWDMYVSHHVCVHSRTLRCTLARCRSHVC